MYKGFIEEIQRIMNETDFSEYNFDEQKTITIPYFGEFRVLRTVVEKINKKKNGRTKIKEDTSQE